MFLDLVSFIEENFADNCLVAQCGEHLLGKKKVIGSNPIQAVIPALHFYKEVEKIKRKKQMQ